MCAHVANEPASLMGLWVVIVTVLLKRAFTPCRYVKPCKYGVCEGGAEVLIS